MAVEGGPAHPVVVVDSGAVQGGPAVPVYGYTDADLSGRPVLGGPATPVHIIEDADLAQNGGTYHLEGRAAYLPVYEVTSGSRAQTGGAAIPVYVMGGSLGEEEEPVAPEYYETVLATQAANLLAYWPLYDTAGPAVDLTGNGYTGSYTGTPNPSPGQTGIGDGQTATSFTGTSRVNVYSAGLAGAVSLTHGTFAAWVKVASADTWGDGTLRRISIGWANSDNRLWYVYKSATANTLTFGSAAGGNVTSLNFTLSKTSWFHVAQTWHDGVYRFYIDGLYVGGYTQTGTYAGTLGATAAYLSNTWEGSLAHAALWTTPLTDDEIYALGSPYATLGGGIALIFDDTKEEALRVGKPALDAAGFQASVVCIQDWVGTNPDDWLSLANLQTLYAAGWDVMNGSKTHTDMTTLSQADATTECDNCEAYLIANAMPRAAMHFVYPFGTRNATTDAALVAAGMLSGHPAQAAPFNPETVNWYACPHWNLDLVDLDGAKAAVNIARVNGLYQVLLTDSVDATTAYLPALITWLDAKNVPMLTMTELYALG